MKTRNIVLVGLFVAIISICSVITIPIGAVPISLSLAGVYLSTTILGSKLGALCQIIYLALGSVGVPVFSGFRGGFQVLIGPTGGYLFSYIAVAFVFGLIMEKNNPVKIHTLALAILTGMCICYVIGALYYAFVMNQSMLSAIVVGILPFIIPDIIKIGIASVVGLKIRDALRKAKILETPSL